MRASTPVVPDPDRGPNTTPLIPDSKVRCMKRRCRCYPHSPSANSGRNLAVARRGSTEVCISTPSSPAKTATPKPSPRRRPGPRGGAWIPPQRPISTNTRLPKRPPSVIPDPNREPPRQLPLPLGEGRGEGPPQNIRAKPSFTNTNTRSNITLSRFDKRCPCQPTLSDVTGDNSAVSRWSSPCIKARYNWERTRPLWKRARVKHGFPTPRPRGRTGKGTTQTCCQRGRGG